MKLTWRLFKLAAIWIDGYAAAVGLALATAVVLLDVYLCVLWLRLEASL